MWYAVVTARAGWTSYSVIEAVDHFAATLKIMEDLDDQCAALGPFASREDAEAFCDDAQQAEAKEYQCN